MISFFSLWLLLVATPLLTTKSIGRHPGDVNESLLTLAGRSSSTADGFLQITRKLCQGPQNQLGTCMFNYECQQQRGTVVGACLDGFLFGACCHKSNEGSLETGAPSTKDDSHPAATILLEQIQDTSPVVSSTELAGISSSAIHWRIPADGSSSESLRIPSTVSENVIQHDILPHLPLVLMFMNNHTKTEEVNHEHESTSPAETGLIQHKVSSDPSGGSSEEADQSALPNLISPVETSMTPSTVPGSFHVLKQEDFQAQLYSATTEAALTSSTDAVTAQTSPPTTVRSPTRKSQPNKRPRPKPTTTTTTTTTTPTPATSEEEESLTDQQANVLQFLVSNPPAWVLDEIINGSTLTTWYPLPIPDHMPGNFMDQHPSDYEPVTTPTPMSTGAVTRPFKRKPTKTRPTLPSRNDPNSAEIQIETTVTSSTTELTTTTTTTTEGTTTTTTTTTTRKPRPVFDYTRDCGVRPMAPEARIVGGRRSDYGRWPWQVLIRESTWFGIFSKNKCGGVLISDRHVLTAAHCQPGFLGSLLVVLGEFDLTGHSEPNTPMERNVKRVVVHRDYVERTFENDLAILELETAVEFKPYIVPICLPSTSDGDFVSSKAEVTGWGKLSHNGPTPGVLFEVDVPIMSNSECHDMFKKAGHEKRILDSFVCAGYAEGKKDSCEGDSGGPLMVERDDGRWTLVGTVSHGIRCAYPNMPGVYMRMTYYRPWIERVTGIGGTQLG